VFYTFSTILFFFMFRGLEKEAEKEGLAG